ncbi:sugar-binding transcriptional regulator [Catenuloplanes japonicus]|uniref:sugar-binding transcriptional regulator n=1 Tax=Catenuloplanes japonicus TaxID=33876 RepID=UPI00068D4CFA|nr:sugar-binding transcriptional regulator [Catenuloplanes japonicus]
MRSSSEEHNEAMLRAAQLYYEQSLTQDEIARRMLLTRWKVGRLLDEARRSGIVKVEIIHPRARRHEEEQRLTERFGLKAAVVIPAAEDADEMRLSVARAAADFLSDLRPSPKTLGVSWGRTLDDVAAAMPAGWARGVQVVQTNGGLSRSSRPNTAAEGALRFAQQGAGSATLLPAPAIVEHSGTWRTLQRESSVRDVLVSAAAANALLFSVGPVDPQSVLVESGYLSAADMAGLRDAGAVGDLLGHFIDRDGRAVDEHLEQRTVGLTLPEVRGASTAILVAAGPAKAEAVRACVVSGLCAVVITDQRTAGHLLEEAS